MYWRRNATFFFLRLDHKAIRSLEVHVTGNVRIQCQVLSVLDHNQSHMGTASRIRQRHNFWSEFHRTDGVCQNYCSTKCRLYFRGICWSTIRRCRYVYTTAVRFICLTLCLIMFNVCLGSLQLMQWRTQSAIGGSMMIFND